MSIYSSNCLHNDRVIKHASFLAGRIVTINKRIQILKKVEPSLRSLQLLELASAVRSFVADARLSEIASIEENLARVKVLDARFTSLKVNIIEGVESIKVQLSQPSMAQEYPEALERKKVLCDLADVVKTLFTKKRKKSEEAQECTPLFEPPMKRFEIDLTAFDEKEKGGEDEVVIQDKGKEKVLDTPSGEKEKADDIASTTLPTLNNQPSPMLPLNLDPVRSEKVTINYVPTMIVADHHNDVVLACEKDKGSQTLTGFDWSSMKRTEVFSIKNLRDVAANSDYAVLAIAGEIQVFGKSPTGRLNFDQRRCIGRINSFYDSMLLSEPYKVFLQNHSLTIATWNAGLMVIDLSKWEKLEQRVRPSITEVEEKTKNNNQLRILELDKLKKELKVEEEWEDAVYRIKRESVEIIDKGGTLSDKFTTLSDLPIYSLTRNDQYLAAGSSSKFTTLVDLGSENKDIWSYKFHTKTVDAVALSKHKPLLYSGSRAGLINIWDLKTKELKNCLFFKAAQIIQIESETSGVFILLRDNKGRGILHHYDEYEKKLSPQLGADYDIQAIKVVETNQGQCILYLAAGKDLFRVIYNRKSTGEQDVHKMSVNA